MLFVTLGNRHPDIFEEAMRRRVDWKPAEDLHIVAEYWLPTAKPALIVVSEAESFIPVFKALADWQDLFDLQTYPVVTADEGLEMAREKLAQHALASVGV